MLLFFFIAIINAENVMPQMELLMATQELETSVSMQDVHPDAFNKLDKTKILRPRKKLPNTRSHITRK